jgi:hypothetical protein
VLLSPFVFGLEEERKQMENKESGGRKGIEPVFLPGIIRFWAMKLRMTC